MFVGGPTVEQRTQELAYIAFDGAAGGTQNHSVYAPCTPIK
jgi:hypothetical protein